VSTKPRLPTNTINSLEDALGKVARMRRDLRHAFQRVEDRTMDPVLILDLAHLTSDLADLERILRDARNGRYTDDRDHTEAA
jgi:hypothetical protein